jgi:hypothetical protein
MVGITSQKKALVPSTSALGLVRPSISDSVFELDLKVRFLMITKAYGVAVMDMQLTI